MTVTPAQSDSVIEITVPNPKPRRTPCAFIPPDSAAPPCWHASWQWPHPPTPPSPSKPPTPAAYTVLEWRHIGPEGNRFSAPAGIAGDRHTYYVGAASGGIYKTTDGGVHWDAIFDDQPVQSIGSLGVAMSDPNIVWAGTGEGKIRSHVSVGQGIYKSTDAGATWTLMGLEQTGRIPRLVIHPTDPDIVFACALGHSYGPQPERGVFRTMDGGETWEHILFVDEDTGCSDIAMDPSNPRVLFAGTWQLEIHTWGRTSGGPGGGLHVSRDGGDSWTKLNGPANGIGLPEKPVGKVAVAVAPSNTDRVYAMLETGDGIPWEGQETEDGQLWRSEDGGHSWSLITRNRNAMGRPHYYSRVVISPNDEDEAYFLTASFTTSTDGGRTLDVTPRPRAPGGDHHDMWIDHTDPDRMIVAHDQGLSISINRGKTWFRQRLTNAQMYHVTVDNAIPYNVLGNKQDEPTYRAPVTAASRASAASPGSHGGCGTTWAVARAGGPPRTRPTRTSCGRRRRGRGWWAASWCATRRSGASTARRGLAGPEPGCGFRRALPLRVDAPIHISPHDNNSVYVGSQHVHRTRNGGQSWEVISPDLTLDDQSRMVLSGGLTGDNIGVEYAGVVFGIAESQVQEGLIWAGTNDGLLHVTRDGGGTWTNVTENMPGLPEWMAVRSIAPSRFDAGTAYVAIDGHQVNVRDPHIYRTRDYGASFERITDGIPAQHAELHQGDRGGHEAPRAALRRHRECDLRVVQRGGRLAAAAEQPAARAGVGDRRAGTLRRPRRRHLRPRLLDPGRPHAAPAAYPGGDGVGGPPLRAAGRVPFPADYAAFGPYSDPTEGTDPEYGASINYWLADAADEAPTVEIVNAAGDVVRTLRGTNNPGVNRVHWDLEDEPSGSVRLLTRPQYADHIEVGDDGRPAPGAREISILLPPGRYTVRLNAAGESHEQPLTVLKDPYSAGLRPTSRPRSPSFARSATMLSLPARPSTAWKRSACSWRRWPASPMTRPSRRRSRGCTRSSPTCR